MSMTILRIPKMYKVVETADGFGVILEKEHSLIYKGIEITKPEQAQNLRAAVNKAVDLFMGNAKKIGRI